MLTRPSNPDHTHKASPHERKTPMDITELQAIPAVETSELLRNSFASYECG